MSADEVTNAFVQHFYTCLDSNLASLHPLYQPQSTLTFEGSAVTGADAIIKKYEVRYSLAIFYLESMLLPLSNTVL